MNVVCTKTDGGCCGGKTGGKYSGQRGTYTLEIQDREFIPVLLGNDINTYGMSRAFYEAYGIRSVVIGKAATGPSCNSRIIDFRHVPGLDTEEIFIKTIRKTAAEFAEKKVILMGCGDNYVEQIIRNSARLPENIVAPYVDEQLMARLLTKTEFYRMCDSCGVEYPATFIYDRSMGSGFTLPFGFPVFLKPSNGIKYWQHEFPTQKKAYRLNSEAELKEVIEQIYGAGYDDRLIIQDFVPGEDSNLRVMICYSGRDRKVKLMSFAHAVLEEHTPHGIGNTAVLMNDYDPELSEKLRNFLDSIGYTGFSTFDIKFDRRDGRYKILEMNIRQGRSNYYVTAAGNNLAKYVVEDHIYGRDLQFEIANARNLWTVIPLGVAFRYTRDENVRKRMRELVREKRVTNPLFMKGDNRIKRMLFVYKSYLSHWLKFRKYLEQ
jgi:D-aspartate ligase